MTILRDPVIPIAEMQILIVNEEGKLMNSCNTIFPTENLMGRNMDEWSPFLTSIFESLCALPSQQVLTIPKINAIAENVEGVFDCLFEKKRDFNLGNIILWSVKDITTAVQRRQKFQQVFNTIHWEHPISAQAKFFRLEGNNMPLTKTKK